MKYITFTIPCYNSENYMRRCVDSLLVGGEDVEILIIDDGSSDRTGAIADEYEMLYPNIVKAVHKGILPEQYLEQAVKGYEAVIHSLAWEGEDLLVGGVCIGTGVGDYRHYCERPTSVNDLHGVGAFLLMCAQMETVM